MKTAGWGRAAELQPRQARLEILPSGTRPHILPRPVQRNGPPRRECGLWVIEMEWCNRQGQAPAASRRRPGLQAAASIFRAPYG